MEKELDCVQAYKRAWKTKDFQGMLLLIKEHSDVSESLHSEERRVFTWMEQAGRMGDVATNVISFWLIQEYLRSTDSRKLLIQKYNSRLKMIVTIALQNNLFIDLLDNLTKQQQSSLEASLVLVELLSANIDFAQSLQSLYFPKQEKLGLLEAFVQILRDYVNDHQKSSHIRLLSAASLINLYSLMNFTDSEDQEVMIPDDTSVSSLSGDRSIDASKERVSDLTFKTEAKSYFDEPDLEIEAERVKEAILNDLFVLIKELSQTEDCWERTKSKISSIAHQSFQSWEVSELVKSIIRLYGSIEASKVLSSKTFTKFFEQQHFQIKGIFRRIRKDLQIEYKYLINNLDQESKDTNKSCIEMPPRTLSPRAHSPRNSNNLESDQNEEKEAALHKKMQLMKLSKMLTSLLQQKKNKVKISRHASMESRSCGGCKLCTIF